MGPHLLQFIYFGLQDEHWLLQPYLDVVDVLENRQTQLCSGFHLFNLSRDSSHDAINLLEYFYVLVIGARKTRFTEGQSSHAAAFHQHFSVHFESLELLEVRVYKFNFTLNRGIEFLEVVQVQALGFDVLTLDLIEGLYRLRHNR